MKKELLDEYTAARWKTPEDIRAFIDKSGAANAEDVRQMLAVLTSRKAAGSPEQGSRIKIFSELAGKVADRNLYDPYLAAIKVDDKHLRTVLVNMIPTVDNPPLRIKLCELLKSPDSHLRRSASQIILKTNDPTLLRHIFDYFEDRNFQGRNEAMDLAGAMPSHYAVEIFRDILTTGKAQEKIKAVKYVGQPVFFKGNPRVVAQLMRLVIHDTDEALAVEAIAVYAKVATEEEFFTSAGDYLYDPNMKLVKAAVEGLRYFDTNRTVAALERKLFTGPGPIRIAVLDTVEFIGSRIIYNILLKALEHKYQPVRAKAGEVLSRLTKAGKIGPTDTIIWLLRSEDEEVRKMAVGIAASIPKDNTAFWGDVLKILKDEDWWTRQRLVEALTDLAGDDIIPHTLPLLSDPSDLIRRFALDILTRLKSPLSFDTIAKVVRMDPDWWVREKALEVLSEIRDPRTVPFLSEIASADPNLRVVAIEAFRRLDAQSCAPQVASFLSDENSDVRMSSLKCLESFGNQKFAGEVLKPANDSDLRVKLYAKDLLRKWNVASEAHDIRVNEDLPLIDKLLIGVRNSKGDDLILLPGNTPFIKKHGRTMPLMKNVLSAQQLNSVLLPVLNDQQKRELQKLKDVDFSYEVRSEGIRFRANIFISRTGLSAVFRIIKGTILRIEDLGLPEIVQSFGDYKDGLVLVGGPTGSGKSTTLTTIINHINQTSKRHVISIEDPIEAVHASSMGLINQREVGVHTPTFDHALKMTLREDPDVILVGEMRDLATIQFAVTAAETGHLVFGTVHTVSADSSVDRLINAYPPEAQDQVRSMLADSLRAVLCQYLIRHKEKQEMVIATELMLNNSAVSNLIRKGKTFQLPSIVSTSREQGMMLMDTSLMELYKAGKISADEAYLKARSKEEFEEMMGIKRAPEAQAGKPASSDPQRKTQ